MKLALCLAAIGHYSLRLNLVLVNAMRAITTFCCVIAGALCSFSGCADSPDTRLVGSWDAELAAAPGPDASLKEKLVHAFTKDAFTVQFTGDQRIQFLVGGRPVTSGTWTHLRNEGKASIIEVRLAGTNTATQERITWIAADQIKWRPPHVGMTSDPLTFRRAAPETK